MAKIKVDDLKKEKTLQPETMRGVKGGWNPFENWMNNTRSVRESIGRMGDNWTHNTRSARATINQWGQNWMNNTRSIRSFFGWR